MPGVPQKSPTLKNLNHTNEEGFKSNDNYPRNGAKIFAGEYAAQSYKVVIINNKNNLNTALSEAAFMTGLERNADVVVMASYAPLFAHTDGWQWTTDLIWVDNLRSYGTPNYYVQKLFSNYKGTHVVPLLLNKEVVAGQDSCYGSATIDKNTHEIILKIVNTSGKLQQREVQIEGVKQLEGNAAMTVLQSNNPDQVNSIENPGAVKPTDQQLQVNGKKLSLPLAPYSFNIVRLKMK